MRLPPIFDPDRNWTSFDKVQHALGCFGLTYGQLMVGRSVLQAAVLTAIVAITFEVGQWDTARHLTACHRDGDVAQPFLPGYGIGVLDLAVGALGIVVALLLRALT